MMTTEDQLLLTGTLEVPVSLRDGRAATIVLREVTYDEVVHGAYVEQLRSDYRAALCTVGAVKSGDRRSEKEDDGADPQLPSSISHLPLTPEFLDRLDRQSWVALREAEERLNFTYALGEIEAAHARGEKLRVVQEAELRALKIAQQIIGGADSSPTTAASSTKAPRRPGKEPSDGYRIVSDEMRPPGPLAVPIPSCTSVSPDPMTQPPSTTSSPT